MKSLDAVKRAPAKKDKRKSPKKKGFSRKKNKKKKSKISSIPKQAKHTLMWVLVSSFMVIIIVGWVLFLQYSLADDFNKRGGGFDEISEGFKNIFNVLDNDLDNIQDVYEELKELQLELIDGEKVDEEVLELREKVFPQFENVNTNSNK